MRKPRMLYPGAWYHVTARANRREMILEPTEIKSLFLEVVAKAKKKYSFTVENFCVMGNHFHMLLRPGRNECLSKIMQWILGVFAMAYNRLHQLSGHVWGERFYSEALMSLRDLLHAFAYIDENPVKAGLVTSSAHWCFGGLSYRRRGLFGVIDPLRKELRSLLPEHAV